MEDGLFNQVLIMGASLLIAFGASYLITFLLIKISKKLVFALPVLFLIASIYFWTAGLLSTDWGALGYLIIAVVSVIVLLGSLGSSLLIYFKKIKDINKD
ncbi:hypothetical protein BK011_09210 [Tenericutes bacterium MZ-XQ]|jgi:hypothetical protein|nr:hypothetical protein BK011_09210 [Tenericutes bacterium MZ-XQ]